MANRGVSAPLCVSLAQCGLPGAQYPMPSPLVRTCS